jgi:hypothetical protein
MRGRVGRTRGFVLLDVMVAIVLLGILLGVLATGAQSACRVAVGLRDRAVPLSTTSSGDSSLGAWTWGEGIRQAAWGSARVLTIYAGTQSASQATVGVWCDGWPLGEWQASMKEPLALGPAVWDGRNGQEVVIRARAGNEGWGPPWRMVVPDQYGDDAVGLAQPVDEPIPALGYDGAQSAVHLPCQSTSLPGASWTGSPITCNLAGVTVLLSSNGEGLCRVGMGARIQSWLGWSGRRLDVYF